MSCLQNYKQLLKFSDMIFNKKNCGGDNIIYYYNNSSVIIGKCTT